VEFLGESTYRGGSADFPQFFVGNLISPVPFFLQLRIFSFAFQPLSFLLFGVIDQDSGKCYILTAEYHSETTVFSINKEWTVLGNVIISNCWKSYVHVKKHGYTVNHSNEFVNKNGKHTNRNKTLSSFIYLVQIQANPCITY